MGFALSVLNRLPGLSWTTGQFFDQHFNTGIKSFEEFHLEYVEFCRYFNTVMPGQDFDVPSREKMKKFYEEWEKLKDPDAKKAKFMAYIRENFHEAKVDDRLFIMAGLAMPAAGIMAKRAGENIPQLKALKLQYVPNVVFVPLWTLLTIMGVTFLQMKSKPKTT